MYSPKCMWDRGTKQVGDFYLVTESTVSQAFTVSRSEQQISPRCNSASSMSVSNSVVELNHELWYVVIVDVTRFLHTVYSKVQCPQTRAMKRSIFVLLSNGSMDSEWRTGNDTNEPFGSSCVLSSRHLSKWLRISFIYARVHPLSKNLEATSNCKCPQGDIQFHSEDQHLLTRHGTKFISPDDQAHGICASLYSCFL
jgi:uncharacterized protein with NRDE domain